MTCIQFLMIDAPFSFDDICKLNEFCNKETCFKCKYPQYYYYFNASFIKNQNYGIKKNEYKKSFNGKTKYKPYYTIGSAITSKRVK